MLDGPLHGGGIPVATVTPESGLKTLFFDGTNYWLTWFGGRFDAQSLHVGRLDGQTARPMDGSGITLLQGITSDPCPPFLSQRTAPRY